MKKFYLTTVLLIAFFSIISCEGKKEQASAAGITWLMGDVKITRDNNEFKPELNSNVLLNDIIKTGENSFISIQVGENLLVKISENSEIVFENLTDPGTKTLSLEKGTVISKVKKMLKDDVYEIKTPTALAAVRGTTFSVSYDELGEKILIVAVSEGKVNVKHNISKKSISVPGTKSVTINQDDQESNLREITESEDLRNKSIDVIPFVKVNDKGTFDIIEDQSKINKETAEINKKITLIEKDKKFTMPKSLSEIKDQYGRVDQVVLYSGKVIKGVILNRGKTKWKILVPGRYTYIDSKDVQSTKKIM